MLVLNKKNKWSESMQFPLSELSTPSNFTLFIIAGKRREKTEKKEQLSLFCSTEIFFLSISDLRCVSFWTKMAGRKWQDDTSRTTMAGRQWQEQRQRLLARNGKQLKQCKCWMSQATI